MEIILYSLLIWLKIKIWLTNESNNFKQKKPGEDFNLGICGMGDVKKPY
jgi:hypothetical protein